MSKLMTVGQAVEHLGFSRTTLRRAIEAGEIPARRTPGGHNRLALEDVEAYAKRLTKNADAHA